MVGTKKGLQWNAGNPGTIRPQKSGHVEIKGFFNMKMTGQLRQCCQGPSKGSSPVSFLGTGLLLHTLYILVNCSSHVFALSSGQFGVLPGFN